MVDEARLDIRSLDVTKIMQRMVHQRDFEMRAQLIELFYCGA